MTKSFGDFKKETKSDGQLNFNVVMDDADVDADADADADTDAEAAAPIDSPSYRRFKFKPTSQKNILRWIKKFGTPEKRK